MTLVSYSKRSLLISLSLILIMASLSYQIPHASSMLSEVSYPSFTSLMLHNGQLILLMCIGTDLIGWPILIVNSLYAGFAIGVLVKTCGLVKAAIVMSHAPLELGTWLLALFVGYCIRKRLLGTRKGRTSDSWLIVALLALLLSASFCESLGLGG